MGCGAGYFLNRVEKWFPNAEITGIDIDKELKEFAASHLRSTQLIRYDGHSLPFEGETMDVVSALQVVEHLERPESFINEASRILRKGGFILLSTPNPVGISAITLRSRWQGYRDDHISLKEPKEWNRILTDTGFCILDEGTTALSGFRIMRNLPFGVINWVPLALFGYFKWWGGESYMTIAKKS